jgi:hypothetical protein
MVQHLHRVHQSAAWLLRQTEDNVLLFLAQEEARDAQVIVCTHVNHDPRLPAAALPRLKRTAWPPAAATSSDLAVHSQHPGVDPPVPSGRTCRSHPHTPDSYKYQRWYASNTHAGLTTHATIRTRLSVSQAFMRASGPSRGALLTMITPEGSGSHRTRNA